MKIARAEKEDLPAVKAIVLNTISEIYPLYYRKSAVDFFVSHHSDGRIAIDIDGGSVFLLREGITAVGTVTVKGNEINRLFVLPNFQGGGFGKSLLAFAEETVKTYGSVAVLHTSLPSKKFYQKHGYHEIENLSKKLDGGDWLVVDIMAKYLG